MKLKDAMKVIDEGWIRKKKGYRICFQKRAGSEWVKDMFPGENEKPLTSDVSAWELARRFAQAKKPDDSEIQEGEIVNISVVDDMGNPVNFYGTNKPRVLNQRPMEEI